MKDLSLPPLYLLNQEVKIGDLCGVSFLFIDFKAGDVLQAHVEDYRTIGSHPRPPWGRRQTLGKRQLRKIEEIISK